MPSPIFARTNDAVKDNPPTGTVDALTTSGSDWLWAVTAVYLCLLLLVVVVSYFARAGEKIFHYLFTISLFTGTIAYFTMASDLGWVAVNAADTLSAPGPRQIFYARYINWFVGWTPLVIAVSLLSCVSWATVIYNVALTWTLAASWLINSVVSDNYKWQYYAWGLLAACLLFASLIHPGMATAKRSGVSRHYSIIISYLCLMFVLYAIAHGLDAGNRIGVTEVFIFIGVVDLLNVPVLACAFLFLSRTWDYRELHLQFTQYGRVTQGTAYPEKEVPIARQPVAEQPGESSAAAAAGTAADAPVNKETV